MKDDVTVVVPTITPRMRTLLPRALTSVIYQEHAAAAMSVAVDREHAGAWVTRGRGLDAVRTTWTAFLDDDDALKPEHLRLLLDCAREHDADYVYSYYDTAFCTDVLGLFGHKFDPENPTHTTMTVMVKTELAQSVGFTPPKPTDVAGGEDWRFTLGCVDAGAKIVHLPQRTWYWYHHVDNTSGRGDRW